MAQTRQVTAEQVDVLDLLIAQHSLIRDLFEEVQTAQGEAQEEAFHRLRRMLAVHETAEEEVVHPVARRVLSGGNDELINDRLAEENEAKKMLGELEGMQPGKPDFMELLNKLSLMDPGETWWERLVTHEYNARYLLLVHAAGVRPQGQGHVGAALEHGAGTPADRR